MIRPQHSASLHTLILPYLEEQSVYQFFDFKQPLVQDQTMPGTATAIGATVVRTFICPSDDSPDLNANGYAKHNYCSSTGPTDAYSNNPACGCGQAAALNAQYALGSRDSATDYPGPFSAAHPSVACRFRQITDGLSKTIFFGEVLPQCSSHVSAGWAKMNNGNCILSTVIPINTDTCQTTATDGCVRPCNWNLEGGFRSMHPGGAQFVMGDASVHFFSDAIDHQAYQYLGGRRDGHTVDVP